MLRMGRSPVSPLAKWIEKMVSEMVETKLPRLCHARRLQLSEQTVDARPNYKLPSIGRSTGRSIPRHNAFYGIGVSRFPFPGESVCPSIRWTIFEERGTRWLASRVGSVTLSSIVFTRP